MAGIGLDEAGCDWHLLIIRLDPDGVVPGRKETPDEGGSRHMKTPEAGLMRQLDRLDHVVFVESIKEAGLEFGIHPDLMVGQGQQDTVPEQGRGARCSKWGDRQGQTQSQVSVKESFWWFRISELCRDRRGGRKV